MCACVAVHAHFTSGVWTFLRFEKVKSEESERRILLAHDDDWLVNQGL